MTIFKEDYNENVDYKNIKRQSNSKDVEKALNIYKLEYTKEKTFSDLKYINKLRYDYWLPHYNLLIEYDGEQHYYNIEHFEITQEEVATRDKIKTDYCHDKSINLLRIPYWYEYSDIVFKLSEVIDIINNDKNTLFNILPRIDEYLELNKIKHVNLNALFKKYLTMLKETGTIHHNKVKDIDYKVFEKYVIDYWNLDIKDIKLTAYSDAEDTHYYNYIYNHNNSNNTGEIDNVLKENDIIYAFICDVLDDDKILSNRYLPVSHLLYLFNQYVYKYKPGYDMLNTQIFTKKITEYMNELGYNYKKQKVSNNNSEKFQLKPSTAKNRNLYNEDMLFYNYEECKENLPNNYTGWFIKNKITDTIDKITNKREAYEYINAITFNKESKNMLQRDALFKDIDELDDLDITVIKEIITQHLSKNDK